MKYFTYMNSVYVPIMEKVFSPFYNRGNKLAREIFFLFTGILKMNHFITGDDIKRYCREIRLT